MRAILRFLQSEDGPAAVEYAVMLALVVGLALTSIAALGGQNNAFWGHINDEAGAAIDTALATP